MFGEIWPAGFSDSFVCHWSRTKRRSLSAGQNTSRVSLTAPQTSTRKPSIVSRKSQSSGLWLTHQPRLKTQKQSSVSPAARHLVLTPFLRRSTLLAAQSWSRASPASLPPCGPRKSYHRISKMPPSSTSSNAKGPGTPATTTAVSPCSPSLGRF